MSEWVQIENLPYSVSKNGEVRNDRTGKILKPNKPLGYCQVRLWVNSKPYYRLVHRLVANAFIENPKKKPDINHKDGNKSNNCVENLEWVTKSENQLHRYNVLGKRGHNPSLEAAHAAVKKKVFCLETGEIFESIASAARHYGYASSALSSHLLGKANTFARLHWRYM